MNLKIKNIFFFIILFFVFAPIFLSVSKLNVITLSRMPGIGNYYGTLPISAILLYFLVFVLITKLRFLKIEIFLLLLCLVFILLSINFKNLVVLKNYIGLVTFILSNVFFVYFFNYLKKNNLVVNFNYIFKFFFYFYFILVIISFVNVIYDFSNISLNKPMTTFISQSIIIFNYSNYYPLSLYVLLVFFYSNFRLNYILFLSLLIIIYLIIILSTSIISEIIFYMSLLYFLFFKLNIMKTLVKYFHVLLIFLFLGVMLASIIINPFTIDNHNIYFRLMIINHYLSNIDLLNFIFPITSFSIFNYSDHNQYFGFLAYGGIIFFILIITYIYNLLKKCLITQNLFVFTIFLILLFGCMVQNFYTNLYFGILISFSLNYLYILNKE